MNRIDVLREIEAVRIDGYSIPMDTNGREWQREMWPDNDTHYFLMLKACIRRGCAIVTGGGMEVKCPAGMVQDAADMVAAWCKKISENR